MIRKEIAYTILKINVKLFKINYKESGWWKYEGFTVDAAKEQNATVLIRGLRNGMDYENEEKMAAINEEISGLNTIYIRAGNLGNISSSLVMSMIQHNKDISKYVPKEILDALLSNS